MLMFLQLLMIITCFSYCLLHSLLCPYVCIALCFPLYWSVITDTLCGLCDTLALSFMFGLLLIKIVTLENSSIWLAATSLHSQQCLSNQPEHPSNLKNNVLPATQNYLETPQHGKTMASTHNTPAQANTTYIKI